MFVALWFILRIQNLIDFLMKTNVNSKLTPQRLMQLSFGYAPPLIVEAAVKYHLFDLLGGSPKTAEQLAREARVSVRGVTAICNALVGRSWSRLRLRNSEELICSSTMRGPQNGGTFFN
jgi:hypothetical protein